jgi:DNA polymerase-3 subunit epsilon
MKFNKPIVWFDLETTGLDKQNDRIVQIAIIRIQEDGTPFEFTSLINPGIPIPKEASDVHGITDDMVKDQPTFVQLMPKIGRFFSGDIAIGGYNSNSFDIPFLVNEMSRAGFTIDLTNVPFIDPLNIFKRKEERTLEAAMKFYCGKQLEGAHDALNDVKATIEVFMAQHERYELPNDLSELDLYCNYDKKRADIQGVFTIDDEGDYVFCQGKHIGKKAKTEKSYLKWMISADFPKDAKEIALSLV